MAAVRYVVVSDLHLGAAYSLLTHTDADGNPHPDQLSATGRGVANGMRSLFGALEPGQAPLPTLVLLGDIFDLSFVPARVAMMAFQQLVLELFDPARPALFDATVLYVPGNHDHREWRVIRDAMFLEQVRGESAGELPERPATTGLLAQPVECQVATALMRRALGDDRYRVESGYPNVGFVAGDRCVVMHHGHFTEGTYRLMSTALGQLTGQDTTTDLDELERINGPWIDFFWSSFGDQGSELSSDVFTLYEIMLDANASHVAIQDISGKLLTLLGSRFGLHAESPITTKWGSVTVGGVVTAALDVGVAQAAGTERFYQRSALSPGERGRCAVVPVGPRAPPTRRPVVARQPTERLRIRVRPHPQAVPGSNAGARLPSAPSTCGTPAVGWSIGRSPARSREPPRSSSTATPTSPRCACSTTRSTTTWRPCGWRGRTAPRTPATRCSRR